MFFLTLFFCNFIDQLSQNFHRFVIYVYVEIKLVGILVFDNYQMYAVSLKELYGIGRADENSQTVIAFCGVSQKHEENNWNIRNEPFMWVRRNRENNA